MSAPRTAAAIAIWNTQVVTWDEGVMDVFGVNSTCCAKAGPATIMSAKADTAATEPSLQIRCRARTGRILTAAFSAAAPE